MPLNISVVVRGCVAAALSLLLALPAAAVTIDRSSPQVLIQQTTDELLAIIQRAAGTPAEEREPYYTEIEAVLNQVIDRDYFARGVMATYGSARLYRSLATDAERDAFKARVQKFSGELEAVLLAKYADALFAFNAEKIEIDSLPGSAATEGKANMQQTIYDKKGTAYKLQYNLSREKDGSWMITNVVVEGVNLGVSYRNQFAEAVEKNRGDVDYVVDNWQTLMSPKREVKE
ncbi:ABC transporter substrate-binding protein [Halioxenophilus sp. WMMB6]|uniref:MlaC/ttg2D family ABC transporter substrate-binding protein n=1 Tax=Halioxenophilus sp. WMMB6 TaxID=3073815 RepID=UPI00295E92D9|nr:ABC transporter substrate-binding protein [Halioxenophilus sp. WMMB6]